MHYQNRSFLEFKTLRLCFFACHLLLIIACSVSEAWSDQMIKIGMKDEPKTLNIWLADDRWSLSVLSQIYQPLYYRDPETLEIIPWLAESQPHFNPEELSYTVKLRPAKWSDGSAVTSGDIAFTGDLINEFKVPRRSSYWKFIKKIETPDEHTAKFYLNAPMAVFQSRTLLTPIVQKKEWEKVIEQARGSEKPLNTLLKHKIEKPVGCGPFALKEWRQGAYLCLERNDDFFGRGKNISGHVLGPYIDGMIFKFYGTSDAAVLALKKGSIDMFWWGIESGYLDGFKGEDAIQLFSSERSALYYMGLNDRKPPLNDPNLRRAIATLIDKDFIIQRILQGQGIKMDSVIPPGNRFWYCPEVPRYGEGLSKEERIKEAHQILQKAGYTWETPPVDGSGRIAKGQGIRLPNGTPMEKITILTPPADYDPARAMTGTMIQEWLREVGIPASAKPMAFGSLVDQVSVRREFDAFIMGYGRLSLDPDYLSTFFHSSQDKVRGGNKTGYRNPDFDQLADQSAKTMDQEKRKKLVCEMQKMILRDLPYIPLYNPSLIEAARKEKFSGWVTMLEGIGNSWSFCLLKPR